MAKVWVGLYSLDLYACKVENITLMCRIYRCMYLYTIGYNAIWILHVHVHGLHAPQKTSLRTNTNMIEAAVCNKCNVMNNNAYT